MMKNTLFQLLDSVQIVENIEDYHFVMKENCIRGNVMHHEKTLFQFILRINHIKFIIMNFGGVINGMQMIMQEILILIDYFLNNLIIYY